MATSPAAGVSVDLSGFYLFVYNCSPGSIGPPPCDSPLYGEQWVKDGNCAKYDFELNPGTYWLVGWIDVDRDGTWDYAGFSGQVVLNEGQVKEADMEIRCFMCGPGLGADGGQSTGK